MGNPSILKHEPGGQPIAPPRTHALWLVYQLRQYGEKLKPEVAMRTGRKGVLKLSQPYPGYEEVGARLALYERDSDVTPLQAINHATLVKMTAEGLLFHGTTTHLSHGNLDLVPQAWWCVVAGVLEAKKKAPHDP